MSVRPMPIAREPAVEEALADVLPAALVARMTARRGSAHPLAGFDPRRTAFVVVDMQNGFLLPEAEYVPIADALAVIPAINRVAGALRAAGGRVVWIQTSHLPQTPRDWSANYDYLLPEGGKVRAAALTPGTFAHALHADLDVQPGDDIVEKTRFSCFLPGTCDLPERLRAAGIDTVLIGGTATDVCCESSGRDAMMLNFRTAMIADANAAFDAADHRAALVRFYTHFGDVLSVEGVLGHLAAARAG